MKKLCLMATCVISLSGLTTFNASAQTGPAAQDNSMKKDGMANDGMKKNGMAKEGMSKDTPSSKDASTQGAGTAGSAEKKGDATSPGGTMKK
jgi:pentapeptide MXKDX repeat protein